MEETKKYFTYILIGGLVVLILSTLVGVIIALYTLLSHKPSSVGQNQDPQSLSDPKNQPPPPSSQTGMPKFASDPAVLQLREDVQNFRKDVDNADYYQIQIAPPVLDTNIQI